MRKIVDYYEDKSFYFITDNNVLTVVSKKTGQYAENKVGGTFSNSDVPYRQKYYNSAKEKCDKRGLFEVSKACKSIMFIRKAKVGE